MSFDNEKSVDSRRKSDQPSGSDTATASTNSSRSKTKKKGAGNEDVGNALRTVYERTVNEDIPPDLLDLLGKLG